MNQSSKRVLSFILALVLFMGAAVIYSTLISVAFDEVQQSRGKIASLQSTLKEEKAAVDKIQKLIAQYQSVQNLQQTLSLSLPNNPNISEIVNDVNGLALMDQVTVKSLKTDLLPFIATVGSPNYVKNIGIVQVTFHLQGKYEGIKQFVSHLQTNVRIFDIKTLKVTGHSSKDNKLQPDVYDYDITLLAYYQEMSKAKANTNR